jgi:hypothetical protein
MTALQETLASFKKTPSGETNGKGPSAPAEPPTSESRIAWQRLIDEKLIEWGRHPEQFEDEDGYKAPSADNLVRATEFITFCRDNGVAPALRIAPDGEGGIVFEWTHNPPYYYYVEIRLGGKIELLVFRDSKLIVRESIGGERES